MTLMFIYMIVAVSLSFLCSVLESVLLSLNYSYIQVLKNKNPKVGALLEKIKQEINVSISAILILNTFAHTLGAAGVGAEAAKIFGDEYMFVISAVLTLIILFASEILPKVIGAVYWKELAPMSAYITRVLIILTYPLVIVSLFITKKISKSKEDAKMTREELLASALLSEDEGIINEQESDVIENILKLKKSKISDILTPRSVVFALEKSTSVEEMIQMEEIHRFSRIPIYDETIDHIIGVVMAKNIFKQALIDKSKLAQDLMKSIFSVHENIPVSYALDLFVKRKEHIFVVLDSYDQTEGILTLEDCIETVLGVEIMDEADTTADMRALAKQKKKKKKKKKLEKLEQDEAKLDQVEAKEQDEQI